MVLNVMGSNPIGHPRKKEVERLPFFVHYGVTQLGTMDFSIKFHVDISGDMFGQQSSARTALGPSRPQRLICSRRRSYIPATVTVSIMSLDVFFQKFLLMFLAGPTMHSHFSFKIRKVPRVHH